MVSKHCRGTKRARLDPQRQAPGLQMLLLLPTVLPLRAHIQSA